MDVDFLMIADIEQEIGPLVEWYFSGYQFVFDLMPLVTDKFVVAFPVFVLVLIVTLSGRRWLAPWARYALWSIVLVRLVLPVSIISPVSVQTVWSAINVQQFRDPDLIVLRLLSVGNLPVLESSTLSTPNYGSVPSTPTLILNSLGVNLLTSFQALLIGGSILVAGGMLIAFVRTMHWMRNGSPCSEQRHLDLVDEGRRHFGIRACVRLLMVPQLRCPATFDWFGPSILLPEIFSCMTASERRNVLWHGLARIRRGDSGASLLLAVVRLLHSWNPLFGWTQHRWMIERELACDEMVIRHLGDDKRDEYVQTLVRFKDHRPKRSWSLFGADAPGFVMLVGANSTLQRRIDRLMKQGNWRDEISASKRDAEVVAESVSVCPQADKARSRTDKFEGRWQYWLSSCVVWTLAVTGLTDAAKIPIKEMPIDLPAGTIWHPSNSVQQVSEADEIRTYDLKECIKHLRKDEPYYTDESAAEWLRQSIDGMLHPIASTNSVDSSITKPDPQSMVAGTQSAPAEPITSANSLDVATNAPPEGKQSRCQLLDGQLTVRATPSQHDQISRVVAGWSAHGQKQITIEIRRTQTLADLSKLLPVTGGHVINSDFTNPSFDPLAAGSPTTFPQSTAIHAVQSPMPVFVRVLTSPELKFLMVESQPQLKGARVSCLFAPKVTIFEGSTATVTDGRIRPFATGFFTTESGSLESQVSTLDEGFRISVFAFVESEKTHLRVSCRLPEIVDVQTRKLQMESKELNIQVPQLRETTIESTAVLDCDETLILVPLERDRLGNLTLLLITPRIIDTTEIVEELNELPRY